ALGNYSITLTATDEENQTVTKTGQVSVVQRTTAIALASSANPSFYGQSVTFTATVSPVPYSTPAPGGTVTFYDGGTAIGTSNLSNGQATLPPALPLAVGTHVITASYSGDTYDLSSTTASPLNQLVYAGIIVLNPTASGALTMSDNAVLNAPGAVVVDSSS